MRPVALLVLALVPRFASAQAVPTWTLVADARMGGGDDPASALELPQAVTVGANGDIYVYDYRASSIKVYNSAGRYLRAIGRAGAGPGEFTSLSAMGWLGDSLWAIDPNQQRVTIFPPGFGTPTVFKARYEPSGSGIRGDPSPTSWVAVMPSALLRTGLLVAQGGAMLTPANEPLRLRPSPIVTLRRNGTVTDTIAAPLVGGHRAVSVQGTTSRGIMTVTMGQPFEAGPFWSGHPTGDGIVVVEAPPPPSSTNAAFTLRAFDAAGALRWERSYAYTPSPTTARMRDSLAATFTLRPGVPASAVQAARNQIVMPRFLPPVTELRVGRDGSVWVKRERFSHGGLLWNVIDSRGTLVARVLMPEGVVVKYADLEQVIGTQRDADGVTWVVRHRVVRARP